MRPLVCLAFLLPALAAPLAALGSDGDIESLHQELTRELQQRIDDGVRADLAAAAREHTPAAPDAVAAVRARVDSGAGPAAAASRGPAAPDPAARPTRMRCRTSIEVALECVVVSKRPGLERIAQTR